MGCESPTIPNSSVLGAPNPEHPSEGFRVGTVTGLGFRVLGI